VKPKSEGPGSLERMVRCRLQSGGILKTAFSVARGSSVSSTALQSTSSSSFSSEDLRNEGECGYPLPLQDSLRGSPLRVRRMLSGRLFSRWSKNWANIVNSVSSHAGQEQREPIYERMQPKTAGT
jgi:hypothetical protein